MNGNNVIIDTGALGLILSDKNLLKSNLKKNNNLGISIITKFEFLSNPNLTVKDKFLFNEVIDNISVFEITNENIPLHNTIISIRKKYKVKLPDAIIAATAIINNFENNFELISTDNDFSKIYNLKFKLLNQ